jgi:hypothetical protein
LTQINTGFVTSPRRWPSDNIGRKPVILGGFPLAGGKAQFDDAQRQRSMSVAAMLARTKRRVACGMC